MGTTATTPPAGQTARPAPPRGRWRRFLRRPTAMDVGVVLLFLVAAGWVAQGLWPHPELHTLAHNPEDQTLVEWFLAADTRVLLFEHGLVSDRLNAPDGVNMLVNATSLTLGLLLAPVTLSLGAPVSFAVITVGNLAATAAAWYLLFARTLALRRGAAFAGGALCGFAPAMISHSNSHWHMTAQWLVPVIVWSVIRLVRAAGAGDRRRAVTSGLWLGGLVVVQLFLGEEVLYLTALTLLLVTLTYAAVRPDRARAVAPGFLTGTAVAATVAAVLLAYPLWVQFAGPGSVPNGPFPPHYYSADLASWVMFSPLSIAGSAPAGELSTSAAEYNTYLGWPLLLVTAACVGWLRREAMVVAVAVVAGVLGVLSLGPELVVSQERTGVAMPYRLLLDVPVIDGALPQRYAMPVVPLVAFLLALGLDRVRGRLPGAARFAAPVAAGMALLPLAPAPLPVTERDPVPTFISNGHWRDCTDPGGVLVPVPLPTPGDPEPMRWATAANAQISVPEGFFIGPYGPDGNASMGVAKRPTSQLLAEVADTGKVPVVTDEHRARAGRDLAYWRAQCVVLGPGQEHEAPLRTVLEDLLGPAERVADAWVWRV